MNKKLLNLLLILTGIVYASCKEDNTIELPQLTQATISGQFTYNNKPVQFEGNVNLDLAKIVEFRKSSGGPTGAAISPAINADGTYKQQILTGDYLLSMKDVPYPFTFDKSADYNFSKTNISANYNINIPVTPYFEVAILSTAIVSTNMNVTFKITRIQSGAEVTKAKLFVGTDSLVTSGAAVSAEMPVADISNPLTIQFSLPLYRANYADNFRDYAFLRIALQTTKSDVYFNWSEAYKVQNVPKDFVDVTSTYLTNFKQPFDVTMFGSRWGKANGWSVNNAAIEATMYDGLGDRMFMGAENWGGPDAIGSVWQSPTLPAGKYVFSAKRGWNYNNLFGRTDRTYLTVSKGTTLENSGANLLARADAGLEANNVSLSVDLELTAPTRVSMGYYINFVGGETNAVSFTEFKILRVN